MLAFYNACCKLILYNTSLTHIWQSRPSRLKPQHSDGKRGLRFLAKPRFTDFSIEPRLASARDGTKPRLKCGPTAWGVRDKLGSSAAQMSKAAVSLDTIIGSGPQLLGLRLAALVGPVYIYGTGPLRVNNIITLHTTQIDTERYPGCR